MPLVQISTLPARNLFPGVSGRYAHGERTTVGEVLLAPGGVVPTHQHPHEQTSYVISGQLEFTVGTEKYLMNTGACLLIPGHAPHGCRAITDCRVIDIFNPVREDYR